MTKEKDPNLGDIINDGALQCTTFDDVQNYAKMIVWPIVEKMLQWEMNEHLWYEKNSYDGINTWNSRNWSYKKKLKTSSGETDIYIPRDRNSDFEPNVVKKFKWNTEEIEHKIISMYWLGLTTRDISWHIKDIYGASISAGTISNITDSILPEIRERRQRPLDRCYPIIYLDAVHFKVKENWKYENKAVYIVLWYSITGHKEILWIYIWEAESSKFWQSVCNDINNRWVDDIMIACIDGLNGFSQAIKNIFPDVEIQRCIIHQIRSSLKYINYEDKKEFVKDLKNVYKANTLDIAESALSELEVKRWKKYSISVRSWKDNWWELSTYFVYPSMVRKIIYTTNIIEGYNRQVRKVTKTTSVFPTVDSLRKLLYLSMRNITKKRNKPIWNRWPILWQLHSFFPKIGKYL